MELKYLEDKWDESIVSELDEPETLRYRSNLLGSDLRITNYGGGNTSTKVMQEDPLTKEEVEVLWVKGSGGDLGSIERDGFARLYMDKFRALRQLYLGKEHENEMPGYYPLCRFGLNDRPASIDTPIHGLVSYKHVDHTHPDWAIAMAAAANGRQMLQEFNEEFGYNLIWLPWERPGFHLGVMLEEAMEENPDAEGVIMASHGLHTWGDDQYECYRSTIEILDAMGQFVNGKIEEKGENLFGGQIHEARDDRKEIAADLLPYVRGKVGEENPVLGNYVDLPEVLRFINSADAKDLAYQGTSCPDHFIRTRVRPLFIDWDPEKEDVSALRQKIDDGVVDYRNGYREYYEANKEEDSPDMRDPNPRVVLIPGVGMFSFGKNRKEARVTGEFYVNAIHVMEGATAMENGEIDDDVDPENVLNNYVALPPSEAFRIEYWELEEAKLKRMPPEKELARQVALVVGGGSGIGRETAARLVEDGAHVVVADIDSDAAEKTAEQINEDHGGEIALAAGIDMTDRHSVRQALREAALFYGGVDQLVITAALFPELERDGAFSEDIWEKTLNVNVTGNYVLADEFAKVVKEQESQGSMVLVSSANAVMPKTGSEPYDVSKAAVSHLIRELALRYAPQIRVNGVSPATVIEGSAMFPRERVLDRLSKYDIDYSEDESTESLLRKLEEFYAGRTLTHNPVRPENVAEAIYYLISSQSDRTSGHILPVDGGLKEAFLR